ncbi:GFA family protein [Halobacteriovorax sp. GFR7]|uniref:GFA family protein n=1 Tax=unclassified Halobacteriovorax TaxID=2639665 RepID=UPI003D951EE1
MSEIHKGSCLCGNVKFEIDGSFDNFFLCHCKYCQKDTGSAHAANLFASNVSFKWISGESEVQSYRLPETRHTKCFCKTCGSAVAGVYNEGQMVVVPAGSLDSPVDIKPNAHLFVKSRANWDHKLENITKFEGLPS